MNVRQLPSDVIGLSKVVMPPLSRHGFMSRSATVAQMEEALKATNKIFEFIAYSGAPHGFHADYRPSYRKDAAEDAWNQLVRRFKKYSVLS